jgi:hypothetical protein
MPKEEADNLMRELNTLFAKLNVQYEERATALLKEIEAGPLDTAGSLDLLAKAASFISETQSVILHGLEAGAAYKQILSKEAPE